MYYVYKRKTIFEKMKVVKCDELADAMRIAKVNISNGYMVIVSNYEIKEVRI